MDINPVHFFYHWANRRLADELAEARRQRNIASREADKARRDARTYLEGQGLVVVEKAEYEGLKRRLQEVQEKTISLTGHMESVVSKEKYEALERRLRETRERERGLQQQLAGMVPRNELDQQRTRAERAEEERDILRGQLRFMVSQNDYQLLQRTLGEKTATVESLQRELAEAGSRMQGIRNELETATEQTNEEIRRRLVLLLSFRASSLEVEQVREESRRRGTIIADVFSRLRTWRKNLPYGEPPEGRAVAICSRDVHGVVASAQLLRIGEVGIGYAFQETWYEWIPQLKISQSKPIRGRKEEDVTREVILVGLYPESDEASKRLNFLHENGVTITLITDRKDIKVPSFVSVRYASSLARAVHNYASADDLHDEVSEKLILLGDACVTRATEEAVALRDSSYDPTDSGYIRGVVTHLSQKGTLAGSHIYDGVRRRAADYRALQRDGFHI